MSSNALDSKPLDKTIPDIDRLVNLFVGAFPRLDDEEQALALKFYELLSEGQAVPHRSVAEAVARSPEKARETLDQWPGVFYEEADGLALKCPGGRAQRDRPLPGRRVSTRQANQCGPV